MTSSHVGRSKSVSARSASPLAEPADVFLKPAVPWRPHGYQKKAVRWLLERACGMLLLDVGLGKTSVALAAIKFLKDRGMVDKVLLVAPLRVCHSTWPRELKKWEDFAGLRMVVLHGEHKDRLLAEGMADVFVVNPDGLPWLLKTTKVGLPSGKKRVDVDVRAFKKLGFDLLVIDELSKFKDTSTLRFKAIRQVLPTFQRRWGLTGSPAPNGLIDLFGQAYVVDEGRSLGRYVTHYRTQFFVPSWDGFSWDLQDGGAKRIYDRIRPLALRMASSDYLEMPKLIENEVTVTLPPKARRVYDELEDQLVTQIDDRTVVAANAATASMKCRQVASGGLYLDEQAASLLKVKRDREWVDLHEEKVEAIADLVDELQGEPLLVAYDFKHDLARLKARFGERTPHIGGGVTARKANEIETAWNCGQVPLLLGHPQSIAHGLNLQGAGRHVAWHSLTWNYELYSQFVGRVHRQGQKASRVFVHHVVAEDTVDESVLKALRSKRKGQQALFDALRERSLARRR